MITKKELIVAILILFLFIASIIWYWARPMIPHARNMSWADNGKSTPYVFPAYTAEWRIRELEKKVNK